MNRSMENHDHIPPPLGHHNRRCERRSASRNSASVFVANRAAPLPPRETIASIHSSGVTNPNRSTRMMTRSRRRELDAALTTRPVLPNPLNIQNKTNETSSSSSSPLRRSPRLLHHGCLRRGRRQREEESSHVPEIEQPDQQQQQHQLQSGKRQKLEVRFSRGTKDDSNKNNKRKRPVTTSRSMVKSAVRRNSNRRNKRRNNRTDDSLSVSTLKYLIGGSSMVGCFGPLSHVLSYLDEVPLYQMERAFPSIRGASYHQWQALRQHDIVVHNQNHNHAKWRIAHHCNKLTRILQQRWGVVHNEWEQCTMDYRRSANVLYGKDYVSHVLGMQHLLRHCGGNHGANANPFTIRQQQRQQVTPPVVPMNMTVGDLARSGYNLFMGLSLLPSPATATSTQVDEVSHDEQVSLMDVDVSEKIASQNTNTTSPDAIASHQNETGTILPASSSTDVTSSTTSENNANTMLHWHAFRKVSQAIVHPNCGKTVLIFDFPVGHLLGLREWPPIQRFLAWHELDWTILSKLIESGRIARELESLGQYERNCHEKLTPIFENMQMTLTLPSDCMDRNGNSVYGRIRARARTPNLAPPGPIPAAGLVPDAAAAIVVARANIMARRRHLRQQMAQLQRAARDLRRQLHGLGQQVDQLAVNFQNQVIHANDGNMDENVPQPGAAFFLRNAANHIRNARDHVDNNGLLQDAANAVIANDAEGNNININPPAQANDEQQPPPRNGRNNVNINPDVNDADAANHGNNDNVNARWNRLRRRRQANDAPNMPPALNPSENPPSPETFIATGRCTAIRWTSYYRREVRRTVGISTGPDDLAFFRHSRGPRTLAAAYAPPEVDAPIQPQDVDMGRPNHNGNNGNRNGANHNLRHHHHANLEDEDEGDAASDVAVAPPERVQVMPWEIRIPISPTLTAHFEVFRLAYPTHNDNDDDNDEDDDGYFAVVQT